MNRLIALLILTAGGAMAQNQEVTRVIELKNTVVGKYRQMIGTFRVDSSGESEGKVMVLRGQEAHVSSAAEFIARLDVAPKNIDFVFYIVQAGSFAVPAGGDKLPTELEPILKQLRGSFVYKSYQLLESVSVRVREGGEGADTSGVLPGASNWYHLTLRGVSVSPGEQGALVRINSLNFGTRTLDLPASNLNKKAEYSVSNLKTALDVREGQRVVVGKSNFAGSDGAYFLIVTAKVTE